MNTYSTRNEAIQILIIDALGEHAKDHDIDAIADEVIGDYSTGFTQIVDTEEFWAIVEKHAH